MFAKTIVLSDAFLDMPLGARCLYMTMGMLADDDGFINAPKSIMRQSGATEDDLKILIAKKFVIPFESGVIVIKHWRINNYLQKDRIQPTKYQEELAELTVEENGSYAKSECIQKHVYTDDVYRESVYTDKNSIGKNSIEENSINTICAEPDEQTPALSGIKLPLVDKTMHDIPLSDIRMWEDAYPAVDIERELYKMIAWLNANPSKRKTKRGINRFINSWLSKVQDRGGNGKIIAPTEKAYQEEEPVLDMWKDD